MEEEGPLKRIRPPGAPKVWKVLDQVKMSGREDPVRLKIQEIPEDRYEDIIDHMVTNFLRDEPLCSSVNGKDDPVFVADMRGVWTLVIRQGISVAAFVDEPGTDHGKPMIAGCNVLGVEFKAHKVDMKNFQVKSPEAESVFHAVMALTEGVKGYEKYEVDRYMFAFGLSVDPLFRGQSLGAHILNAREDIGREYEIPVTITAFTSPISQKLADRCGFEVLVEKNYADMLDEDGNPKFPNVKSKCIKIMGRRLY